MNKKKIALQATAIEEDAKEPNLVEIILCTIVTMGIFCAAFVMIREIV